MAAMPPALYGITACNGQSTFTDPSNNGRLMQSRPLCIVYTLPACRRPLAAGSVPLAHGSSQSKNGAAPKQHPSYGLLEKNGFQPEKYETYMKRCLQERAAQGGPLCMFQSICACLECMGPQHSQLSLKQSAEL